MRDAVNPEEPGGGVPQRNTGTRASGGWCVLVAAVMAALVAGMFILTV